MRPRTLTTMSRLSIGDRFYKVNDRKRIVYQRVPGKVKRTLYRTYGFWAKSDNEQEVKAFIGSTPVVFLRHSEVS